MISVVDSGGANLGSLIFSLNRLGVEGILTRDKDLIQNSEKVLLPGVGAFDRVVSSLQEAELMQVLKKLNQPVLGICVGMQVLFDSSEEGELPGMGVFSGRLHRLPGKPGISVPHMGWNTVEETLPNSLLPTEENLNWFYFTHSFFAPKINFTIGTTTHGVEFSSICQNANFYGVQFHPERSSRSGLKLLENFLSL